MAQLWRDLWYQMALSFHVKARPNPKGAARILALSPHYRHIDDAFILPVYAH